MRYRTKLTDKIITSEQAKEILNMVSPIYGDDYVSLWLFQIIGSQLDKSIAWVEEYIQQLVPQTATWALPYWESEYRLVPDPSWTIEQRRLNIISKMWSNGPMNPTRLAQIIKGVANADVSISENTGKNRFTVYINTTPYKADNIAVNKTLDKLKPSHLIYHTIYSTETYSDIYIAGVIQKSKIITLPTIDAIYRKTLNGALNTGGVLQYSKSITLKEG